MMFSSCEDTFWVLACTWKFIPGYDDIDGFSSDIIPHYFAWRVHHSIVGQYNNDCIVHSTGVMVSSWNL
jgi:hypothetical protein